MYSLSFLLASLVQAGIVIMAEWAGLTTLGARATAVQLLVHVLVGQAAGYGLLLLSRAVPALRRMSPWITGPVYGFLFWAVALSIAAGRGAVRAPWTQGWPTVVITLAAFVAYGVVAAVALERERAVEPVR